MNKITYDNLYECAVKTMSPKEIKHYGTGAGFDDLYLKKTQVSDLLVSLLPPSAYYGYSCVEDEKGEEWYAFPMLYRKVSKKVAEKIRKELKGGIYGMA